MPTLNLRSRAAIAAFVVAVAGTAATAGPPPQGPPSGTGFTVQLHGGGTWSTTGLPTSPWTPASTGNAGEWHAEGFEHAASNGWLELQWNLDVHEDPFVSQSFTLTNTTASTQTYTMTTTLPALVIGPTFTVGSISGTLTNNNVGNAVLSTAPFTPLYTALIDGMPYMVLLPDPYVATTAPFPLAPTMTIGPASFGPLFGQPGVTTSIAVSNTFTLTPGDTVQLTSTFFIESEIPAPASAALLGVAGLVAARRRR